MTLDCPVVASANLARPVGPVGIVLAILGVCAAALALFAVRSLQFNVANYTVTRAAVPMYWSTAAFLVWLVAGLIVLWWRAASGVNGRLRMDGVAVLLHPLLLCAPLSVFAFIAHAPPFAFTWMLILSFGLVALRAGARHALPPCAPTSRNSTAAVIAMLVALAVLTIVHVHIQINYFEHFMLGHSDIGHFTEELKNALHGRGLRSDSFPNTRLGWHFTPLLFILAPGYALFPTPVYLMVCGPILVYLPAVPAYFLARRLSGSVLVGECIALAWLLLPSCSRLFYANTYGFPWIVASMVLIALTMTAALCGRWKWSIVFLVLAWLCEETTTAATLGWGIAVAFALGKRRLGIVIAAVSVGYFVLCTQVLIPAFAASGRYERFSLFGDLGGSVFAVAQTLFTDPRAVLSRFLRPSVWSYFATLLAPMAFLPLLGWRIAIAAAPPLLLICLLQSPDWISIKFWHQTTVLPVLFFAGVAGGLGRAADVAPNSPLFRLLFGGPTSPAAARNGLACALLTCSAMGHYLYGFSPLAKSFDVYAGDPVLQSPDPRLRVVEKLREDIHRDRAILATERLAAHFTDYRRIYTGGRIRPADFVVIDRGDRWDTSGLPQRWGEFAASPDYELYAEFGEIIAFSRRASAVPPADD